MKEAVIVAACRSAIGRAPRGSLKDTRPEKIATTVMNDLLKRANDLDPNLIDDFVLGCAFPEHSQGMNFGRVLTLAAGWPDRVPAMTVNRFCSSGLQSIAIAAEKIMCGFSEIVVAGGVDCTSQVPMVGMSFSPDPELVARKVDSYSGMGLTAENVAEKYKVSREDQDAFGCRSQNRAEAAQKAGRFKSQITPVQALRQKSLPDGRFKLEEFTFDEDEGVRAGTTVEALAKLKPAFKLGGSVTAGNSSQTSDGAAAVLVMTKEKAKELGLKPIATFRCYTTEGCPPALMGIGPAVAIPKVLRIAGKELKDIELIELNEAFAAQAITCVRELGLNEEITNVNGGAIALGHPLGCTGSKLTTQLLYEMQERKQKWGMVSMCIGMGMGAAGLFEIEDY
jgi:acetyl-CoA acyltransferase